MALYTICQALINPGDEVIIVEPFFDCYAPQVRIAGGVPVFLPLEQVADDTSDWRLDLSQLEGTYNRDRLKALIINNPNNPLGKVYSVDELEQVAKFCIQRNIICISDEVYEHLVYR